MTDPIDNLPDAWRRLFDELDVKPRPVDSPSSDSEEAWFELYSKFATRGFVRGLAAFGEERPGLRLQFAIPSERAPGEILEIVRAESADVLEGNWEIEARDPDWEIGGRLDDIPEPGRLAGWLRRLEDLGRVAESGRLEEASWLAEGLGGVEESNTSSSTSAAMSDGRVETAQSRPASGAASTGGGAGVFESIGNGTSDDADVGAVDSVGIDGWELMERSGGIEARIRLDRVIPPAGRETIARALAHALRSRYDIAARPLPGDDSDSDAKTIILRSEPSESGLTERESPAEIRSDMESYLDRLVRFEQLGVDLAAVLGVGDSSPSNGGRDVRPRESGSESDSRDTVEDRKRGRGRREEGREEGRKKRGAERSARSRSKKRDDTDRIRAENREEPGESKKTATAGSNRPSRVREDDSGDGEEQVVLGVDNDADADETVVSPESGLEAGNYRDPRLMREDATTSLVDIVLRHPGYAEEKMGHNLSILLSIDFPDAMDLVERAPSIIAWGVGRERALKFKRFIENSGGKVVLVEPDSLSD